LSVPIFPANPITATIIHLHHYTRRTTHPAILPLF